MSYQDLSQTLKFIDVILKKYENNFESDNAEEILIALSIAIIVTYWKPFLENKARSDVKSLLPDKSLNKFSKQEMKLHEKMKKIRNKEFAHSDPDAHDLDVYVNKVGHQNVFISTGRGFYLPMEKYDALLLKEMISKILDWISLEIERIQNLPGISGNF